jgi:hypothetical protein
MTLTLQKNGESESGVIERRDSCGALVVIRFMGDVSDVCATKDDGGARCHTRSTIEEFEFYLCNAHTYGPSRGSAHARLLTLGMCCYPKTPARPNAGSTRPRDPACRSQQHGQRDDRRSHRRRRSDIDAPLGILPHLEAPQIPAAVVEGPRQARELLALASERVAADAPDRRRHAL